MVMSHQKGVRLVLEAQHLEAQEEARRLDVWTQACANSTSSLPDLLGIATFIHVSRFERTKEWACESSHTVSKCAKV